MARPTVDDLARHARITAGEQAEHAADLDRYLAAAVALVEAPCGPLDDGTARRVRLRGGTVVLPFAGVLSATVASGAVALVVDENASDYGAGVVKVSGAVDGYVTVTVARDPDAADALWLAALIVAANLWALRRGARASRPAAEDDPVPTGYAVPPQAWSLMAPWMLLGVA